MISSVPIMWRLKNQRYQMIGSTCPDCGEVAFPPREVCPHCVERAGMLFPFNPPKAVEEILVETFLVDVRP
jgi:uncharacterized OB-fold protein